MFVQNDATGSLEVERVAIILMENLHFSHRALFEGKPMCVSHKPTFPVNHWGGVQMRCAT